MADGKVGPQSGSGENHPRRAAVFSPETLPFRSIRRKALVVQRVEMPGIHNLKNKKIMQQSIITRQSPVPMRKPVAQRQERHVHEPAVKFPPRGSGPVHISVLLDPILEICRHPDGGRLLAEFLKDA